MIDFADFFKLLLKRKYILIGIPLVTIIITYFLVRNLPDVYISKSRIATGIVDDSQQSLEKTNKQESEINQEFNNLIQMIQLKKMVDQVSYQLIMHDFKGSDTFKGPSSLLKQLNADAKKHAYEVYDQKHKTMTELSLYDKDQNGLNEVLKSMGYDEDALRSKLGVYRVNNSDYIDVTFESENPKLSAFVVNTLCTEFIRYYDSIKKSSQDKTVDFLEKLLQQKYAAMNNKISMLKAYKIQNHILNLNEQAKSLYGQIADFETRKQTAEKEIISYTAALKDIDNKFKPEDRKYIEAAQTDMNGKIVADKDLLRSLNEKYVSSNFDEQYQKKMDSVRSDMTSKIRLASDKYILNPLSTKQDLVTEKLGMEVTLDLAKNSVASLQQELVRLSSKFDRLVPHEAVIQAYENDIDVASREYLEILDKYNQTSLQTNFAVKLRQLDTAMPGSAQPSKKMLLVILSGIISFVFCLVTLFVLFYLDDTIKKSKDLAYKTKMPVLGYLNLIIGAMLDLKLIWQPANVDGRMLKFKDLLRSVRFEIEKEMKGSKMLVVTSMKENEGKTFFAISLAYACSMANLKVLLIDGNFNHNAISETVKPDFFLEDILRSPSANELAFSPKETLSVIGNRGEDISLLELAGQAAIKEKFNRLKEQFDIVIVESSSLDTLNKAKEWLMFTDHCTAVFEANQSLNETKKQFINFIGTLNDVFIGWVLNKVTSEKAKTKTRGRKFFKKPE